MNVPTIETLRRFTNAPRLVVSYENEENEDEFIGVVDEIKVSYRVDVAMTVWIRFKWLLRIRSVLKGDFEKIQTRPVTGSLSVGNTMEFGRLIVIEEDESTCVLGSLEKVEEEDTENKTKKKRTLEKKKEEKEDAKKNVKEVINLTIHPFQLERANSIKEEYDSYSS